MVQLTQALIMAAMVSCGRWDVKSSLDNQFCTHGAGSGYLASSSPTVTDKCAAGSFFIALAVWFPKDYLKSKWQIGDMSIVVNVLTV